MYTFIHNLLNVLVQIANKIGFKKRAVGSCLNSNLSYIGIKPAEEFPLADPAGC
jgi:hypothetical protein